MVKQLQSLEFVRKLSVKERYNLLNKTKYLKLEPDEYLVSFDLESLHPNVPIKDKMSTGLY